MPKRVLVVDDDPAQRRILEETIKRLGIVTKARASGDKALRCFKAGVLLHLPCAARFGDARHRWPGGPGALAGKLVPPAIVQTAHGSIDAAIRAMRAGAVDFVVKPVSPERLKCRSKALKIEALADEIVRIRRSRRARWPSRPDLRGTP